MIEFKIPWFMFDIKSVCPLLRPIMTLALTFINGISSNSCSVFLSAMVFKVMVCLPQPDPLWNIQCSNLERNAVKSRIQVQGVSHWNMQVRFCLKRLLRSIRLQKFLGPWKLLPRTFESSWILNSLIWGQK